MGDLTQIQELVLRRLGSEEVSGPDLQGHLREQGHRCTGPGFYRLMAHLELDGLVTHEIRPRGDQAERKVRYYRRTKEGHLVLAGSGGGSTESVSPSLAAPAASARRLPPAGKRSTLTAPRRPRDRPFEEVRAIKAVRTLGAGKYGLVEVLHALQATGWSVESAHRHLQRAGLDAEA